MNGRDSVDARLPLGTLMALGLQHVLVMYAGAVAVPLIIGAALKLPKEQIAFLINADLLACGLVTLIQTIGWKGVGIRLPIMMGVTFTAIGPMIAIGSDPNVGLLGIYGATIAAGIFGLLIAPVIGKLLRLFPPIVTGTEILAVGLSLMGVAVSWAGGGYGNPDFGNPMYLCVAAAVLTCILLLVRYGRGFVANISILLGLLFGFIVSAALGQISLDELATTPWLGLTMPFHFGVPTVNFWAVVAMCVVMVVTFIESTGMFLAVGEIVERPVKEADLVRGFRADGIGTIVGGVFNTFPYTSFAQNVGLVSVTNVKSRWVCVAAGFILIALGVVPKLAVIVASIPPFVLGGAGIVMFGMVAASGIKVLARVDFHNNMRNLYIVAISIGIGMIPVVSPKFFGRLPHELAPLLESSILLTAISAVILNLFFNGLESAEQAKINIAKVARDVEV